MNFQHTGPFTQKIGEFITFDRIFNRAFDGRISGYQRSGFNAEGVESNGKRAGNIGEPPVLIRG